MFLMRRKTAFGEGPTPGIARSGFVHLVIGAVCAAFLAGAVHAQDRHERSYRGRIGDTSIRMDAEEALLAAGVQCRVVRARFIGRDETRTPLYEAACADGDAYTVIGSPINRAFDCLDLDAQAVARRENRNVPAVRRCTVRPARSLVRRIETYAVEAGLDCHVDQGRFIGHTATGSRLFEAGCRGRAGAWLEQSSTGWIVTDCFRVQRGGGSCTLTSAHESAATAQQWLSTSPRTPGCHVIEASFLGESRAGGLYEASCEGGDGYIVRRGAAGSIDAIFPCAADFGVEVHCGSAPRRDDE
jgi:hypothetical protein